MRTVERFPSHVFTARTVLSFLGALLITYLAAVAAFPSLREHLPRSLRWFGAPNSAVTIAITVAVLSALGVVVMRAQRGGRSETPVVMVAGLASVTTVLGMASYWRCQDDSHPDFFTPLLWTAALVDGGDPTRQLSSGVCPSPMPVALNIAQICALAAVLVSVVGVAVAVFRARFDRLAVRFSRSVTAVVGLDDDTHSLLGAVARTTRRPGTLVVLTDVADGEMAARARSVGARVLSVNLDRTEALVAVPIWHKLDRLYLMAPDASTNLVRLRAITARGGDERQRIPLVVRIDDPWQAAAWRARHFGGAHNRWAADTVGVYDVTARRLLDRVLAGPRVDRLVICGTSQLVTALCGDMLQRRLEFEYSGQGQLPRVHIIAENADEYRSDYEFIAGQLGHAERRDDLVAINEKPSTSSLFERIADGGSATTALIFVEAGLDGGDATRLAARYPETIIHVHDPRADTTEERLAVVGRLYTYQLSLDMPGGQAHDAWERAAALIHNRYVAESGATGPTAVPWAQLDEFYRESNRRQVRNALWMVERIGGHTWNSWGLLPTGASTSELRHLQPLDRLRQMGFDSTTAEAMAHAEHEDWCRYYRKHGWRFGPHRDDTAKIHDKLVAWEQIRSDPRSFQAALRSLAATLTKLRELGYRSHPALPTQWAQYRRSGVVLAEQRTTPWTWTTADGSTMHAEAGDWAVREINGDGGWSVRDDIFRATHEHLGGQRWRRLGTVLARPAERGEVIDTLEGTVSAPEGSWVVQGDHGDMWAVPGDEFTRRYEPIGHRDSVITGTAQSGGTGRSGHAAT